MAKQRELGRLDIESSAAIKAGMSYGYWKAMHPNVQVEIEKPKAVPEGWRVCEWCGKAYKPRSKRPQKFCEAKCQRDAADKRRKESYNAYMRKWRAKQKEMSADSGNSEVDNKEVGDNA